MSFRPAKNLEEPEEGSTQYLRWREQTIGCSVSVSLMLSSLYEQFAPSLPLGSFTTSNNEIICKISIRLAHLFALKMDKAV
jgi:hypothetical protein